jgi:hypothetical protein
MCAPMTVIKVYGPTRILFTVEVATMLVPCEFRLAQYGYI